MRLAFHLRRLLLCVRFSAYPVIRGDSDYTGSNVALVRALGTSLGENLHAAPT